MVRMTLSTSWLGRIARGSARVLPASIALAALMFVFASSPGFAQLSGSYTIGTGQTYTTVGAFVTALNTSGVNGPVTATVLPGTYTGSISINAITGASSTNTITIQGQNVSTCIVEAATNGTNTYVILLNGADYVRIRNLTINATGTTYGYGVWFQNQADYNELTGCKVNVSTTTTNSYCVGVLASGAYYYSTANSANYTLIEGNEIKGGYYGVNFMGYSSTTNCLGNQFNDNTVTDWYYFGMYLYYQGGVVVDGNTVIDRGATPYSYGIYSNYNRTGPKYTRNTVVAGYAGLYLYYVNQDNSVYGQVCNNMITLRNTAYYNYGLQVYYYPYKMYVDNNSINLLTSYYAYGLYGYYYGGNNAFRNNIIRYAGTTYVYFVYVYPNYTYWPTMDYNVFYAPSTYSYAWYYNGYDYSLNDFKAAVSGQNANSWMYDPEFITDFNLHTYSQNLNNTGTALTHVTLDRDGDTRSATTPDIGADEYTLFAVDAGAKLIASPVEGCGLGATEDLIVGIRNYGTTTLTGSSGIVVQVTVTGPINQSFTASMTSGTIAPGATYNFTVSTALNLSIPGQYTFNATASASGDGNAANNAMDPLSFFVDKTVASYPYFENFEANNGSWRSVSLGGLNVWEWGDPSYSGTYPLNTANSGTNAWMTDLDSNYPDNHFAALMSPCFDMTTLTSPVFQFYANYACESAYDGWNVDASGNGGQSWTRLYPYNPPYNYSYSYGPQTAPQYSSYTNNTWKKYVFLLGSYASNPNVKLRIVFGSDASVNGYPGVAIDDPAVGDFYQKDIVVTDVVYDNATNYWARRQNANHVVHARIVNYGYETNPTSVSLTYKQGSAPAFDGDGVSETFNPSWSGSEAWVTFSTQHMPVSPGPMNLYVKAFYAGDQNASNDMAMTTPVIQPQSVFGYEDFNSLTPPNWEKGWTVLNVNNDETWENTAGAGIGGTNAASYPGSASTADDWLFTPGAMLLAGSSYSVDFMYRSRNNQAQILEVAYGPSPDPNSMTVFAVYNNFTNPTFTPALGQYGVAPFFNTPNVAQLYYIGFHVRSAAGAGPLDIDDIRLSDNPFPPPKIAYGIFPIYIDDPTIPLTFSGVYKKTGLLSKTFEVVNSTGWYGNPEGDMLWDVTTPATWINLIKSTPDPLMYLSTNPFNPPWARQNQTFTMEVNASILPPGKHISSINFDAYLYNTTYTRGIRASNAIFSVPVELDLSQAGGSGTNVGKASMTLTGLDGSGNPYEFRDSQGLLFARVWVTGGFIPSMTVHSYPGQLPMHISKYRYVDHYWTIDAPTFGWTADIEFHYFDSEVASGGVFDEYMLRGMRIAPGTGFWEDPIMGTNSSPDGFYNYVYVQGFNPTNFEGEIAVAHDYFLFGKGGPGVPSSFSLDQNFPNPFNPSTDIRFGIPSDEHVTLTVMNTMGEEVARLVDAKRKAGYHTVEFNASKLPSGMYLYRITAGDFVQTRTMILNK